MDEYPNILFLRGCFLKDCVSIEDIFDARLIQEYTASVPDVKHDKIPEVYVNLDTWPKKTNLLCWECSCSFQSIPLFIPRSVKQPVSDADISGDMNTIGNFCSWGCAARYINLHFSGNDKWEKHNLLRLLYKKITGRITYNIRPAQAKTVMIQYGGSQTIQEFRA